MCACQDFTDSGWAGGRPPGENTSALSKIPAKPADDFIHRRLVLRPVLTMPTPWTRMSKTTARKSVGKSRILIITLVQSLRIATSLQKTGRSASKIDRLPGPPIPTATGKF
jgi:hypothetical protein